MNIFLCEFSQTIGNYNLIMDSFCNDEMNASILLAVRDN